MTSTSTSTSTSTIKHGVRQRGAGRGNPRRGVSSRGLISMPKLALPPLRKTPVRGPLACWQQRPSIRLFALLVALVSLRGACRAADQTAQPFATGERAEAQDRQSARLLSVRGTRTALQAGSSELLEFLYGQ